MIGGAADAEAEAEADANADADAGGGRDATEENKDPTVMWGKNRSSWCFDCFCMFLLS